MRSPFQPGPLTASKPSSMMMAIDRCLWHITTFTLLLALVNGCSHVFAQEEVEGEAWWGEPKDDFEGMSVDEEACVFTKPEPGYLYGCHRECAGTPNVTDAQLRCAHESNCRGLTLARGRWELRTGVRVGKSGTGELSIQKICRSGAREYQEATESRNGARICGRDDVCLCSTPELELFRHLTEKKAMQESYHTTKKARIENGNQEMKDIHNMINKIKNKNNNNNKIEKKDNIEEHPECCGNGVCEANECSINCIHDCGPSRGCSGVTLDIANDDLLQSPQAMKCDDNGICFCRDALDLNCCGDGTCAGPECMSNCPNDCALDLTRLCPAEKFAMARKDLLTEIAPEPPLQVGMWETAPPEIVVVSEDEDEQKRSKSMAELEEERAEWETKADEIGYDIKGEPSIFVSIASFRDDLCRGTVESALAHAAFPERVIFGIVQQNLPSDNDCIPSKKECIANGFKVNMPVNVVRSTIYGADRGRRRLCALLDNIRVHPVDARQAAGPTWARYRVDRMYEGETFVLQIDAHMFFTSGWDNDMIQQWSMAGNEYAVLTSYPTDTIRTVDRDGTPFTHTFPVICGADFVDEGVVRAHGAVEQNIEQRSTDGPMLHPYFAAGMSFARGHRVLRAPNDCCTPMMFIGEEFGMTMRMWTRGYDMYAFGHSAVFHVYPWQRQEQSPMFWENSKNRPRPREQDRSNRRLRAVLGIEPHGDYDDTGLANGTYALGRRRTVEQFAQFFGLNVKTREVHNDVDYVLDGGMHRTLTKHMRPDGRGIDFSSSGAGAIGEGTSHEEGVCAADFGNAVASEGGGVIES